MQRISIFKFNITPIQIHIKASNKYNFLSNMLATTSNKLKSPKFKSNFNIYKKVKSEKMRGVKKWDIIWNTSEI